MNNHGQSIVEIALITPLILVALYVPVDFGMAFFVANITQTAVRDVARMASVSGAAYNATRFKTEIVNRLPRNVTIVSINVTRLDKGAPNCMKLVTASATIQYPLFWYKLVSLVGVASPGDKLTITRHTTMRWEAQPYDTGPNCVS